MNLKLSPLATPLSKAMDIVLAITIGFVVLSASSSYFLGQPFLFSYALSSSMEPTIGMDDGFIIVPDYISNPSIGDIIVFQFSPGQPVIVHRIVGKTDEGYVTRGDNSVFSDQQADQPLVTGDMVVGTVMTISGEPIVLPYFGRALGALSTIVENIFFLASLILALVAVALLRRGKVFKGKHGRPLRMRHAMALSMAVIVVWGTLFMATASSVQHTDYVVNKWIVDDHVFDPGESFDDPIDLSHRGIVPAYVILSSQGGRGVLDQTSHLLSWGSDASCTLHVTCPDEMGYYTESVTIDAYLPVLPPSVIDALYSIDPLLPIAAIDAILVMPLALYYFVCCDGREQVTGRTFGSRKKLKKRWNTL